MVYLLTHSIQQSPSWEANRFSVSQEIPHILRNPKVHYRIHKCPPPAPIRQWFAIIIIIIIIIIIDATTYHHHHHHNTPSDQCPLPR